MKPLIRRTAPLLSFGILSSALIPFGMAAGANFVFDGQEVALSPPAGYCALDAQKPGEDRFIDIQKQIQAAVDEVVIVYADCADLDALRAGTTTKLNNIGNITIVKNQGKIVAYKGVSRQELLDQVAKSLPAVDFSKVQNDINATSSKLKGSQITLSNAFGLLRQDELAVYVGGTGQSHDDEGNIAEKISVNAVSLINSLPVGMSIGRFPDPAMSLPNLVETQQRNMAALIQANASLEAAPGSRKSGFNWHEIAIAALVGAVLSLVLAGVRRATGRRRPG